MTSFSPDRYNRMPYRRCGKSGLKLPAISLGCWHNFGANADHAEARQMLHRAFDRGVTHFDLANNYGPPPGSAEQFVGKVLREDFAAHRDELIISTKAGYLMWPGPYGEYGSRKYMLASLDQSLDRLQLDYVDIFYSHRPDPETPLEETIGALDSAVRAGKALYVGISSYDHTLTARAAQIARDLRTPLVIHQPNYSMLDRWVEKDLLSQARADGLGIIAFCPLSQGLLTNRYLGGIPKDSRAASPTGFLREKDVTTETINRVKKLAPIAERRGQSIAQLALAWVLRDPVVTSALIGASRVSQLDENIDALKNLEFHGPELNEINRVLAG